jgi:integrase
LISRPDISDDRRLYYACMLLGGMRPGEIAALHVRHYEPNLEPLGRLTVALALNTRKGTIKGTKTNAVRHVPVHPTLAAMLGGWLAALPSRTTC